MRLIGILLVGLLFFNSSCCNNMKAIVLIDENEYFLGEDYALTSESVFLLNENYKLENIDKFCDSIIKIYEETEIRKKLFFETHPDGVGWKESEDIIEEMKYPVIYNKGGDYQMFLNFQSGDYVDSIVKRSKINFNTLDSNGYYKFRIYRYCGRIKIKS